MNYLRRMEWGLGDRAFAEDWPPPVRLLDAKGRPYWTLNGYAVANTEASTIWQRKKIRDSAVATVSEIPWC